MAFVDDYLVLVSLVQRLSSLYPYEERSPKRLSCYGHLYIGLGIIRGYLAVSLVVIQTSLLLLD